MNKVLFSGRFDPVHPGHIASIIRLTKIFDSVIVCILDYPERVYPLSYISLIFEELLEKFPVHITSNKIHFGKISLEEFKEFDCDWYASGNLSVLRHMESLGINTYYVERSYDYSARYYKNLDS